MSLARNDYTHPLERPSTREREVLALLVEGLNNDEIAQRLHLKPGTVKNSLSRLFLKFYCRNRTELAVRCLHDGFGLGLRIARVGSRAMGGSLLHPVAVEEARGLARGRIGVGRQADVLEDAARNRRLAEGTEPRLGGQDARPVGAHARAQAVASVQVDGCSREDPACGGEQGIGRGHENNLPRKNRRRDPARRRPCP